MHRRDFLSRTGAAALGPGVLAPHFGRTDQRSSRPDPETLVIGQADVPSTYELSDPAPAPFIEQLRAADTISIADDDIALTGFVKGPEANPRAGVATLAVVTTDGLTHELIAQSARASLQEYQDRIPDRYDIDVEQTATSDPLEWRIDVGALYRDVFRLQQTGTGLLGTIAFSADDETQPRRFVERYDALMRRRYRHRGKS